MPHLYLIFATVVNTTLCKHKLRLEKNDIYFYKKSKGDNPPTEIPTLLLNTKEIKKSIKNLVKANEKLL